MLAIYIGDNYIYLYQIYYEMWSNAPKGLFIYTSREPLFLRAL